ncbi:MAG: carboxymuconolactone decarboxylase family protein [Rhodospirillales bacterium]|nr:carboxymuconolactone decarboxylase family protein [Rhodospirillales bacterium]
MTLDALKAAVPDYARDLRLNLDTLATEPALNERQRAGTFIASALATRQPRLRDLVLAAFAPALSEAELTAAKTAAALMGMNNIYYRFTHLVSAKEYQSMPARLRMNAIAKPGAEKADFELWSTAVSAINGCGMCMDSHERTLRSHGVGTEAVQAAVRIAAVINAIAVVLDIERDAHAASAAAAA